MFNTPRIIKESPRGKSFVSDVVHRLLLMVELWIVRISCKFVLGDGPQMPSRSDYNRLLNAGGSFGGEPIKEITLRLNRFAIVEILQPNLTNAMDNIV